jgi:hypothetical protein
MFGATVLLVVVWVLSSIYYSARSFRYLNSNRTLGRSISLTSDLKARKVFGVYLVALIGFGVAGLLISLGVGVLGILVAFLSDGAGIEMGAMFEAMERGGAASYGAIAIFAAVYLLMFALFSALNHVLMTQPLLRLFAQSLQIDGADALNRVHQREGVDLAEAEGFADALDVGAAF